MKNVFEILLIALCVAIYYLIQFRRRKKGSRDDDQLVELELSPKPRVIILKGYNDREDLEETLSLECDEDTYGPYRLEYEEDNVKLILQDSVKLEDIVDLLTVLNLYLDETSSGCQSGSIKCHYPIGKITFGDNEIADTDAIIYPIGNPKDLIVNICTRDNKIYQYSEVLNTIKEIG